MGASKKRAPAAVWIVMDCTGCLWTWRRKRDAERDAAEQPGGVLLHYALTPKPRARKGGGMGERTLREVIAELRADERAASPGADHYTPMDNVPWCPVRAPSLARILQVAEAAERFVDADELDLATGANAIEHGVARRNLRSAVRGET